MKVLAIAISLFLLSACTQSSRKADESPGYSDPDLPPVSVFYSGLSEALRGECLEYRARSMMHYCRENTFDLSAFAEALSDSGRFRGVVTNTRGLDYQLLVSSAEFQVDDAESMANAVVAGASLMLLPMKVDMTLKTEFVLLWRGNVVDRFSRDIPIERSFSLFNGLEEQEREVGRAMAVALLEGVDEKELMSAGALADALGSSAYESDVVIPEEIDSYRLTDRHLYHDPLGGAQYRFNHKQFAFDRIDVFVYPIRLTDWSNRYATIQAEMARVTAEIEYVEKEGHISNVALNDPKVDYWSVGQEEVPLGFMDGYYVDPQSQRQYTSTYVFIQEDKFIKVRASFPEEEGEKAVPAPNGFVRALIPAIAVPEESLYMARLRKDHIEPADSGQ